MTCDWMKQKRAETINEFIFGRNHNKQNGNDVLYDGCEEGERSAMYASIRDIKSGAHFRFHSPLSRKSPSALVLNAGAGRESAERSAGMRSALNEKMQKNERDENDL